MILVGEPLALDLLNTRWRDGDLLEEDASFRDWLAAQQGRLTPPEAEVDLDAVRRLRQAVQECVEHVRAGGPPPAPALRVLNEALRHAPAHRELDWPDVLVRRGGDPTARLLAELAESAVDLLAGPDIGRVRGCAGPGCRLLFLPAHPRRRWCSAALCGNRVRVARYYRRHNAPADGASPE
ncbi:CGNR zinc finger domain-containing protein [Streptosporangium sp. NPDC050855]|uniref:CGNR zinc finger domain-containing protein n=1 Tax=Streptosporangium sp. NPDC050855 TaxID=3366194 RepID=UPI00379E905D